MLLFPMEYQPLASQGEQIMERRKKHLKTYQEAAVIVKDGHLRWVFILGEVEIYFHILLCVIIMRDVEMIYIHISW